MPFDSNGVFSRVMNWTRDQQDGIAIECGRHDDEDDNFAQGFNDCFCRDGRAPATGNFNLGGYKIQNLANATATTDAVNKGQMDTALNAKANTSAVVTLTGTQTITGKKSFASNISCQNNNITKGTNPSSTNYITLEFTDKNGSGNANRIGMVESSVSSDGLVSTEISSYNYVSGSTSRSRIAVFQPKTGVPYTYAPASDVNNSILTTVNKSKSADGNFQLGNGLIINWGQRTSGEAAQTITFSRPFTSTNYFFCATWKSANNASAIFCTTSKTTTNCNITKLNYSGTSIGGGSDYTWFAIGY